MKKSKRELLFWDKVDIQSEDECWEWQASKDKYGYGYFSNGDKTVKSHRFSWELHHKKKIPNKLWVLHSCDNSSCVNPNHLFLGTHQDNVTDCYNKGRSRGSSKPLFYEGEIWLIRRLKIRKKEGFRKHFVFPTHLIAKMFNSSYGTIYNIWNKPKIMCREGKRV
jgi:hypothetical protein